MRAQVTPWFPADVSPVRNGLYECERTEKGQRRVTRMLWWDGDDWSFTETDSMGARHGAHACMFVHDGDKWRGLAQKP